MKSIRMEGTTIEKKITLRPMDIPQIVHERITRLIMNYGMEFKPLKILLGPNEWLLLTEFMRTDPLMQFMSRRDAVTLGHPETLLGYPVGLKQSEGIEFEFNPSCAFFFVKGVIGT